MERVKEDFNTKYGGGKAKTAGAKSLNKEFDEKLKEHMQYYVDHPEEVSKLAKVKAQVAEVKGVTMGRELLSLFYHLLYYLQGYENVATKFPANALVHRPTLLQYIVSSKVCSWDRISGDQL
ncbi:unnamed protein product [Thlaspi arvense]|uniref:Longin domain-containing protein n=1 Tax=Thlaspi arvense TaxID=13288 RepID=A0AAU9RKV1_THLAR|nr:unnamed protein product [Thlaspi arvense]